MNPIRAIIILFTGIGMSLSAQVSSVVSGDITNNVSPTFTTPDNLLTLTGYSDSASTVPANLTTAGASAWFGVGPNDALDGTETIKLQFASGAGLAGFGDIWTRAVISISGFVSDPGLNIGSNPGVNSFSYSSGVLTLDLGWNGGGARDFTLADPSASAGQLLTVNLDYATSPQWAITHLDYAPVPEPSIAAVLLLGGGMIWARARGCRRK